MLRWFKCEQEGDVPSARDSHSVSVANNQVFIFGGQDQDENLLNDLYKVTLSSSLIKALDENKQEYFDRQFKLTW